MSAVRALAAHGWLAAAVCVATGRPALAQAGAALPGAAEACFVENRGQWPEDVRFAARGGGWRAAVEERGWRVALAGDAGQSCVVRFRVTGGTGTAAGASGADTAPGGLDASAAQSHYFQGQRSGLGARSFARVRHAGLADGVDLVLRCEDGRLEYDLDLAPHADLAAVVFEVEGASVGAIAADGSLALETPLGVLLQTPPRAFELDGQGRALACAARFVRLDESRFGFALEHRPPGRRVVIDPALVWSTYIGGGATQSVRAIADAAGGGAVIAGNTESADFPVTPGVFDPNHNGAGDVFVARLDGQGGLVWSTFLGGLGDDQARAIAVDAQGGITVAGTTHSSDFPASPGAFDTTLGGAADGFVARLSSTGAQLAWCTYLGGAKHEELGALALGAAGLAAVGGWTTSTDFPVTPGTYDPQLAPGTTSDGCLAQLSADGSALLWSSYFGGGHVDSVEALALVPGAVLVGGTTQSLDFPYTSGGPLGGEDGFVARFDASATQLLMSSVVGGSGNDVVRSLATDGLGAVFAAGRTNSPDLLVTPGAFGPVPLGLDDGFLARFDFAGVLAACSYLGGSGSDEVLALAHAKTGELLATGWTDSPDFPTTPGAFDLLLNVASSSFGGDAFVVRAAPDLTALTYATFFGAGDDDRAHALVALDADTVLLAGETGSFFFPTTPGAHRTSRGILATLEGFATRFELVRHPIPYGTGNVHSYGGTGELSWTGFPSVAAANFSFVVDGAIPNQPAVVFLGKSPWSQPFLAGTLYVRPPLKRVGAVFLDFVGYAELPYALPAWAIGKSLYAQAWFQDPLGGFASGLTSGLDVFVYP